MTTDTTTPDFVPNAEGIRQTRHDDPEFKAAVEWSPDWRVDSEGTYWCRYGSVVDTLDKLYEAYRARKPDDDALISALRKELDQRAEADAPRGRSEPGEGDPCYIFVLGRADRHADSLIGSYGKISAGCGPNLNEDFAVTNWPVVVKVKPTILGSDLIQHLRDLADSIESHQGFRYAVGKHIRVGDSNPWPF